MPATEETIPLYVADCGDLEARVDAFLAQQLGEAAMLRLMAFHRPTVRQFALPRRS